MHGWSPAREHSQHFDDIIHPRLPPLCVETSLLWLREWSRHRWKNKSRGGAACKQMKREKAHLGEAKGGWQSCDPPLAHTQEGERDTILKRVIKSFAVDCSTAVFFFCCFYNLDQSSEVYPSPFWILLRWNGDAWLHGLASGQQTLAKNTSVISQLYSSFFRSSLFGFQWPGCVKKQLGSTSWFFLLHQLLILVQDDVFNDHLWTVVFISGPEGSLKCE